jgi:hypothetical protein
MDGLIAGLKNCVAISVSLFAIVLYKLLKRRADNAWMV